MSNERVFFVSPSTYELLKKYNGEGFNRDGSIQVPTFLKEKTASERKLETLLKARFGQDARLL